MRAGVPEIHRVVDRYEPGVTGQGCLRADVSRGRNADACGEEGLSRTRVHPGCGWQDSREQRYECDPSYPCPTESGSVPHDIATRGFGDLPVRIDVYRLNWREDEGA